MNGGVSLCMLICKMFSGTDPFAVQETINVFLNKTKNITIHSICQSSDSSRILLTMFFNVKSKNVLNDNKSVEQIESIVAQAEK